MAQKLSFPRLVISILVIFALFAISCSLAVPTSKPIQPPPEPEPENHKPIINYLTSQQQVIPLSSTQIRCVASDTDNDTLTYTWTSNSGTIKGSGETIEWTAPDKPGAYIVMATVTDSKSGEVRDSVTIMVTPKPNRAPALTLIVREKNQPPVTANPTTPPVTVKKWSSTEIECIAEDPDGDELNYKWSTSGGSIEGTGPKVLYISKEVGDFSVTITVTDSRGAQSKTSAYFHVPCCGGF